MYRELLRRVRNAHHDSANVIIGKKGITREVLREIDNRLDKHEVIKVKMLRTAVGSGKERKLVAMKIAREVNAKLMGVRGRTFVLYRPRKK